MTRSFAAVGFFLRLLLSSGLLLLLSPLGAVLALVVTNPQQQLHSSSSSSYSSSYEIKTKFWEYKSRYKIGYEVATAITTTTNNNNKDDEDEEEEQKELQVQAQEEDEHEHDGDDDDDDDEVVQQQPILLLNGFGVGSFHQHRLIHELFDNDNNHNHNNDDDDDDDSDNDAVQQQQQQQRRRRENTAAGTVIYCIDYLGQGRSWPINCHDGFGENEQDLQYSANTWCEQIIDFIEMIILPSSSSSCRREETETENNKDGSSSNNSNDTSEIRVPPPPPPRKIQVHLVGNSVGGHLAAHIAVRRPDLISSICLLNPTPVWGSKLPGWDGHLPPPAIPKRIGRYLFDRIRDLDTIESFLAATYSRPEAVTDELMNQIRDCTLGNGGHAAFASIMWSPPVVSPIKSRSRRTKQGEEEEEGIQNAVFTTDFYDCLKNVSCDVLLAFGKDDPWCKPVFAKSMLSALEEREQLIIQDECNSNSNKNNHNVAGDDFSTPLHNLPVHRYVEITNTGHCPNHESPKAVSYLVKEWIDYCSCNREINNSNDKEQQLLLQKKPLPFVEEWGTMIMTERRRDEIEVSWMDKIVASML